MSSICGNRLGNRLLCGARTAGHDIRHPRRCVRQIPHFVERDRQDRGVRDLDGDFGPYAQVLGGAQQSGRCRSIAELGQALAEQLDQSDRQLDVAEFEHLGGVLTQDLPCLGTPTGLHHRRGQIAVVEHDTPRVAGTAIDLEHVVQQVDRDPWPLFLDLEEGQVRQRAVAALLSSPLERA